jgi:putative DeoR family transcriptional regulator (stage III sporulation protein D)
MEERALRLAEYVIEHKVTVRSAAERFGVSKSTVHKDLRDRLPDYDPALYRRVCLVLEENKAERHIRGGLATRRKYKGI